MPSMPSTAVYAVDAVYVCAVYEPGVLEMYRKYPSRRSGVSDFSSLVFLWGLWLRCLRNAGPLTKRNQGRSATALATASCDTVADATV
jgi:hypothetical protein